MDLGRTFAHAASQAPGGPRVGAAFWEDLPEGFRFVTRGKTLSEAEILDFGFRHDPQPFHIDVEAAREFGFDTVIASGFQTLLTSFTLVFQFGLHPGNTLPSPGVETMQFLQPVNPGDTLKVHAEVTASRPSATRPDRGITKIRYLTHNQHAQVVMQVDCVHFFRRRGCD